MNPLFIKVGVGIGVGVIFSVAALLMLFLRRPEGPHYTNEFTGSYIHDDPTRIYVCCICLEDIECTADKSEVFALPCGHKFHRECLKKLLAEQTTNRKCPYCRRHIPENVVSSVNQC